MDCKQVILNYFKEVATRFKYTLKEILLARVAFYLVMNQRKAYFSFDGQTYRYFYRLHNKTWTNERAVEIPIICHEVRKHDAESVLEIGKVLSYYCSVQHDILDKYETADRIINADIVDFRGSKTYDLIVSISTLEHVGYDEYRRYGLKDYDRYEPSERQLRQAEDHLRYAIENIKNQLSQHGKSIVTAPLGFNPVLDALVKDKSIFTSVKYLKRVSKSNLWIEALESEVQNVRYDSPFNNANALVICIFQNFA
jgi:hypothetical protein